jgi:hypothetical protein
MTNFFAYMWYKTFTHKLIVQNCAEMSVCLQSPKQMYWKPCNDIHLYTKVGVQSDIL